jgi:putative transposase
MARALVSLNEACPAPLKLAQLKRESSREKEERCRESQFTEEQIIRALKEVEAGATGTEVCRRLGVSEQTFYRLKAKFGGMDVSDVQRLRALEEENRKVKLLLAE